MQVFEYLCVAFGILTGIFMAFLPEQTAARRPILAVTAFSLTLTCVIALLPVVLGGTHFITVALLTVVGAVLGFVFVTTQNLKPVVREQEKVVQVKGGVGASV